MSQLPELQSCNDHGVMLMRENDTDSKRQHCPCCELGLADNTGQHPEGSLSDIEFRNRMSFSVLEELVPLMESYLADNQDEVDMWIVTEEYTGQLPAGYTETERPMNMLCYRWGSFVKAIIRTEEAEETIETLRENGYGE